MSGRIGLDRMALADASLEPSKLAAAILDQIPSLTAPVPVEAIAEALGIVEIRVEVLTNLEAALLTSPERLEGKILLNAQSSHRRRRFSIGHELGHFTNIYHEQTGDGFSCSRHDMAASNLTDADRHRRQEAEANRFAVSLLAPTKLCAPWLRRRPEITVIEDMADTLDVSLEATARRYVELTAHALAVVFSQDGRIRYVVPSRECPRLQNLRGVQLPPGAVDLSAQSASATRDPVWIDLDPQDWLRGPFEGELTLETVAQRNGQAISILHVDGEGEEDK